LSFGLCASAGLAGNAVAAVLISSKHFAAGIFVGFAPKPGFFSWQSVLFVWQKTLSLYVLLAVFGAGCLGFVSSSIVWLCAFYVLFWFFLLRSSLYLRKLL